MPDFLYQWPLWIVLTLLILFFCSFALLSLSLVRNRLSRVIGIEHIDSEFASVMVHSMIVFYGLVAALITVNVYETYSDVHKVVSREAAAISSLYRDTRGYPDSTRTALQAELRDYVQQIIHEAWPQQSRGVLPTGGIALVTLIEQTLFDFEPTSEGQKLVHSETLQAFREMVTARRLRLDANLERLPGMMWNLLIFGGLLCLFAAGLFHVSSARLHALLVTLLAVLMAAVLFMTFVWDRPYLGERGIKAEPYEIVYDHLMR